MKRIYLAGPMRGYPRWNHHIFDAVSDALRLEGNEVFNSAECDREHGLGLTPNNGQIQTHTPTTVHRKIMLECCRYICEKATHVYMLPGWRNSKGAFAENRLAIALDLQIKELSVDTCRSWTVLNAVG